MRTRISLGNTFQHPQCILSLTTLQCFRNPSKSFNIILSANGTIVFMSHCFYVFIRELLFPPPYHYHVGTKICDAIRFVMGFCRLMTKRAQYNKWLLCTVFAMPPTAVCISKKHYHIIHIFYCGCLYLHAENLSRLLL